jgi:hypothetical protein
LAENAIAQSAVIDLGTSGSRVFSLGIGSDNPFEQALRSLGWKTVSGNCKPISIDVFEDGTVHVLCQALDQRRMVLLVFEIVATKSGVICLAPPAPAAPVVQQPVNTGTPVAAPAPTAEPVTGIGADPVWTGADAEAEDEDEDKSERTTVDIGDKTGK